MPSLLRHSLRTTGSPSRASSWSKYTLPWHAWLVNQSLICLWFVAYRALFEQDNIDKDKETKQSKSNIMLMEELGGTAQVISALKSDTKIGIDGSSQDAQGRITM